jgi:hypothetical protein
MANSIATPKGLENYYVLSGRAFIQLAGVLKNKGISSIAPSQLEEMGRQIIQVVTKQNNS